MNPDHEIPDSNQSSPVDLNSEGIEEPNTTVNFGVEMKPGPAADSDLVDYSMDPEQEWRVFQNNSSSLSGSWRSDQERYAKLCHAAVEQSLEKLSSEPMTVKSLYEFLAGQRHAIAEELHQASNKKIGKVRTYDQRGEPWTPIIPTGKYGDFFTPVKDRIIALYNKEPQEQKGYIIQEDTSGGDFRRGDWVVITDGDLRLTGITYPKENEMDIMLFGSSFIFLHTEAQYIPKIYEKIDNLFKSVLDHPQPTRENMQKIGEMVWYLAHAMPCERGSAATTEMFARTMMKKIGLPIVPYEHQIPLDFEALTEPDKTKFIERFTTDFYPKLSKYYEACVEKETLNPVEESTGSASIFKSFKQELNKIIHAASEVLENWNSPKNR